MPRYDLMHWSQRVRDEQAARYPAVRPFPSQTDPPAPSRPKVTRPKRPKPTPDPEADQLLRLCETGRLYELEAWIASGKAVTVPADYKKTPLEVARRTGFHSLVELLLRHEPNQATKDALLVRACHDRQPDIVELALRHGANANAVPLRDALFAWDRTIVARLLECGADPITDYPFARAFQARVRTALGCYLDCRRTRPELADALQEQADMALRHACSEGEARWVGLLLWIGANPRAPGLAIDEIDDPGVASDPEARRSALQAACGCGRLAVVKQLKPDPERDDMTDLLRSIYFLPSPELLTYLLKLGANPNDKANGGSSALDKALMYLDFGQWSDPYGHTPTMPSSKAEAAVKALQLDHGARWRPENRTITDVRRTLYRLKPDAIAAVVNVVRPACDESVIQELTRTPKMQAVLRAERRRHVEEQQRAARAEARGAAAQARTRRSEPTPAPPAPPRYGAYNRERLYEQVWTEPTQEVAKRYGVSDVMIAKACRILRVPKPPRGYWAKKAAGQALPPRPPLPN